MRNRDPQRLSLTRYHKPPYVGACCAGSSEFKFFRDWNPTYAAINGVGGTANITNESIGGTIFRNKIVDYQNTPCEADFVDVAHPNYDGGAVSVQFFFKSEGGAINHTMDFDFGIRADNAGDQLSTAVNLTNGFSISVTASDFLYWSSIFMLTPQGTPGGNSLFRLRLQRNDSPDDSQDIYLLQARLWYNLT